MKTLINWFRNMKIRSRMLFIFMLVILLIMTLLIAAVTRIVRVSDHYMFVIRHPMTLESTLLEFGSEYRDLRRIVATILLHVEGTGMSMAEKESLFASANARYEALLARLRTARTTVATNPYLGEDAKKSRIANNDMTRSLIEWYRRDVLDPAVEASKAGDRGAALPLLESATPIALALRSKLDEMIQSAKRTADDHIQGVEQSAKRIIALLISISIIATAFAIALALYAADRIARPLAPLAEFMKNAAATGDISFREGDAKIIGKYARRTDELGLALTAAEAFVGRITDVSDVLKKVADGNLSVQFPLLSDKDVIGTAIGQTLDGLNEMFAEINDASSQVAIASSQVADGAQVIASGAAEQATSIEELSNSISGVSERTRQNAEMAGEATQVAGTITANAEKGRERMEAMLSAVARISEASQEIAKVIKVIDSIAFQTNILALNASVEAAHAGRHGKGFAVVADEVRSLAAKSAEAAKETQSFIADSVEKTKLGVRIAEETSASLLEIVSGINENSRLIGEIAYSSEQQSLSIAQINASIDQLSRVVQQNSATAEESAAASREMSRQSTMLQRLIAQFRLKRKNSEDYQ